MNMMNREEEVGSDLRGKDRDLVCISYTDWTVLEAKTGEPGDRGDGRSVPDAGSYRNNY